MPPVQCLITMKSSFDDDGVYLPASRSISVGCVRTMAVSQKKVGVLYTYFSPVISGPWLSVRRRWVFSTLTFLLSCQDHGCHSEEGGCSLHLLFSCHIRTMAVSQKKVGVLYTYFSPVMSGPWLSFRRRWVFSTLTFLLSYQDHGCQSEEGGCSLHLLFSCHVRTMAVSQKKVGVLYTYFSLVMLFVSHNCCVPFLCLLHTFNTPFIL